jgi:hypothetical protein
MLVLDGVRHSVLLIAKRRRDGKNERWAFKTKSWIHKGYG